MLLPPTCLPFSLPVSPACLSVSQTSMDDSGHKGNIGQLLNSRVLGVLLVITLFMTLKSQFVSLSQSYIVCTLPLSPHFCKFKKRGGLDRTSTFRGGCWDRGGDFFTGVQLSHNKLNLKYLMTKKVYKQKYFSL